MASNESNILKYILLELVAVAFLATGGIFVRLCSLSPINCGFYRILFALPFIFWNGRKELNLLSKKDIFTLLLAGIFFATDVGLANVAFSRTSVANVNLLSTLTPLTIVPITYFLFKEKIPRLYPIGLIVSLIGVFVLVSGKINPTGSNYIGDIMAFASSVFYALFLLVSYKMRQRISGSTILFVAGIGSVATFFVYASVLEGFQIPNTGRDLFLLIGLAMCMQVVGQGVFAYCQGKMSVNISSVVGLIQPAFAVIYSWIMFSEKLSIMELVGILIVVTGIFLVKLQYNEKNR